MTNRRHGWLDGRRREAPLFALIGALLLVADLLQPWADARAAETARAWVICTAFGMEMPLPDGGGTPPGADDCPQCLTGACSVTAAPPRSESVGLAFPRPPGDGERLWHEDVFTTRPAGDPPPAIRAPPLSS
jgi:hypothetical protein